MIELVIVCLIAAITFGGFAWAGYVSFTHEPQIQRAKRDVELAALRAMGTDRNRPEIFR